MLTPFRVDTNSLFVTERLNEIGIDVRLKLVAGDDVEELAELLRAALGWADLIVMTGGLGPTEDDITRAAVARLLQVPLDLDETIVDRIRDRFQRRGHGDAGDQPAPGDGPARRDGAAEPERHRARTLAGAWPHRVRAAARPAARDEADVRGGGRRAPRAAHERRRVVPARAAHHRTDRIGRRRDGAAD